MKTLYTNPPINPIPAQINGNLILETLGIKNAEVIDGWKEKLIKNIPTPNITNPTIVPFIIPLDRNPPTKEEIINE